MPTIDLRSDTVTQPSMKMRDAMFKAEVGDDVFGEDPTVAKLEALSAKLFDKEAAIFVASGTMGNLIALLCHCGRGEETILGHQSHIHIHEQGGVAGFGSIHTRTVPNLADGTMELAALERAINEDDIHCAHTKLICLENTWHGRVLPMAYLKQVKELAARHQLKVHLDGARIFNAATSLKLPVKAIAEHTDTVQFCLSKGLACPVGSVLCGTEAFIKQARRMRKALGGGMRQAGILAACGLVALETMVERLSEDHANAQLLAEGLRQIPNIVVKAAETNMVFFSSTLKGLTDRKLAERLKEKGLLVFDEPLGIRAVTHYGIDSSKISKALETVSSVMKEQPVLSLKK